MWHLFGGNYKKNLKISISETQLKFAISKPCPEQPGTNELIHWGRVTQICISKLTIIVSDNGLSPDWHWAIIWNNAGILLIGALGTSLNKILIKIYTFSFKKMHLTMISGKWQPFCLGINVLKHVCETCSICIISISIWRSLLCHKETTPVYWPPVLYPRTYIVTHLNSMNLQISGSKNCKHGSSNTFPLVFWRFPVKLPFGECHMSRVSCQKGPTRHAYAWQIGPFWQDTLNVFMMNQHIQVIAWQSGTKLLPVSMFTKFYDVALNHSSPPEQNGCHFTDDIFRCIFLNEKFCILTKISLKFVPESLIENNPAPV